VRHARADHNREQRADVGAEDIGGQEATLAPDIGSKLPDNPQNREELQVGLELDDREVGVHSPEYARPRQDQKHEGSDVKPVQVPQAAREQAGESGEPNSDEAHELADGAESRDDEDILPGERKNEDPEGAVSGRAHGAFLIKLGRSHSGPRVLNRLTVRAGA